MGVLEDVRKEAENFCKEREVKGTKDKILNDYGEQVCRIGVRKTLVILADSKKYKVERVI